MLSGVIIFTASMIFRFSSSSGKQFFIACGQYAGLTRTIAVKIRQLILARGWSEAPSAFADRA